MDLKIGILKLEPGWKLLLDQMGFWWEEIGGVTSKLNDQYSLLIINDNPKNTEAVSILQAYLNNGGAILDLGHLLPKIDDFQVGRTFKKTFYPPETPFYTPNEPIDIYRNIWLHPKGKLCEGALHWEKRGDGAAAFLGWEIAPLMIDERACYKQFYHPGGKAPYEHVSLVSKAEISRIIFGLIKWLHTVRHIPLVQKWHLPDLSEQLFLFRVDTDFSSRSQIEELSRLAGNYKIPVSWFLHVHAHHEWLQDFPKSQEDEIAAHGFEHQTKEQFDYNYENLKRALQALWNHNYQVKGFAAPYGMWNASIARTVNAFDLDYSSEFGFFYNHLPCFAEKYAPEYNLLQIPVHPICIGSFRRTKAGRQEIESYFDYLTTRLMQQHEPLLLYHHPGDQNHDILSSIFKKIQDRNIQTMTFNRLADWWRDRQETSFIARWQDNKLAMSSQTLARSGVSIAVHQNFDECTLWSGYATSELMPKKTISFPNNTVIPVDKLKSIRGFKPRLIKQAILDLISRLHS